jgi:hypothetical protein
MTKKKPSPQLVAAAKDSSDIEKQYGALLALHGCDPNHVVCKDLLLSSSKNYVPVPDEDHWDAIGKHRKQWDEKPLPSNIPF